MFCHALIVNKGFGDVFVFWYRQSAALRVPIFCTIIIYFNNGSSRRLVCARTSASHFNTIDREFQAI